jgi:carbon-monoxide dehydrogenase iron sulfur subunit
MNTVFINPERCIGCKQCESACAVAHSQSLSLFWSVFENPLPKPRIHAEPGAFLNTAFPNKCRHCNPAPCQGACPTGAIDRAPDMPDIVLIEAGKCIACGMCAVVCPFDVISYYASADAPQRMVVALKCDNCIARQRAGQIPACVEACKVGALQFGEINAMAKQARTRYSQAVSQAVGAVSGDLMTFPAEITNWRGWGQAVSSLNAEVQRGG